MKEPVEISVLLEKDDVEKLLDLCGQESLLSDYLARVIQRLYREKHLLGDNRSMEEIIQAAESIADQAKEYRARLKRMTMSQEELMATVDHLRSVTSTIYDVSNKRKDH